LREVQDVEGAGPFPAGGVAGRAVRQGVQGVSGRVLAEGCGMSDWKPIETAPMDGTHILVLHEGMTRPIISWVTELDVGYYKGSVWMPLPEPPK
jgi:hypothetical protein